MLLGYPNSNLGLLVYKLQRREIFFLGLLCVVKKMVDGIGNRSVAVAVAGAAVAVVGLAFLLTFFTIARDTRVSSSASSTGLCNFSLQNICNGFLSLIYVCVCVFFFSFCCLLSSHRSFWGWFFRILDFLGAPKIQKKSILCFCLILADFVSSSV